MNIGDIMTECFESLNVSETIKQTIKDILWFDQDSFPVVLDEIYMGIIHEKDLLKYINDERSLLVSDVMTHNIESVDINDSIDDIIDQLLQTEYSFVPVTNNEKLIGIVSVKDILRYSLQ